MEVRFIDTGAYLINAFAHDLAKNANALSAQIAIIEHHVNRKNADPQLLEYVKRLKESGQQLFEFLNILLFYKPAHDNVTVFDTNKLLEKLLEPFEKIFGDKNIRFSKDFKSDELLIKGNQNSLLQAITLILLNAINAVTTKPRGNREIIIATKSDRNEILISVVHNAKPLKDELIQHIFDPFFSVSSDSGDIGLYSSKLIIEQNFSGKIECFVREELTTFLINLESDNELHGNLD